MKGPATTLFKREVNRIVSRKPRVLFNCRDFREFGVVRRRQIERMNWREK